MPGLTVAAGDLFDGLRWLGPATVRIDGDRVAALRPGFDPYADLQARTVLPGLVDWGTASIGCTPAPGAPPFATETAFARTCLRWGVTTVVDVANTAPALAHLAALAARGAGPRIARAGGRLCTTPNGRCDVLVDAAGADRLAAAKELAGASLVSLGRMDDEETVKAVLAAATARRMPIVLSRQWPRETPGLLVTAEAGVPDVPGFVPDLPDRPELPPLPAAGPDRWWYVPQLEAAARWTLDGLLAAGDPALSGPYGPGAGRGLRGRRQVLQALRAAYGDRTEADLGAERDGLAATHLVAGTCLASSGSGHPGLLPGRSLWAELDRLAALLPGQAGTDAALRAATGSAGRPPPLGPGPGAGAGLLVPGHPADLLLCGCPGRGEPPSALRAGLTAVVTGGLVLAVPALAAEVAELTATAYGSA